MLLIKGFYEAARTCLGEYGGYSFVADGESSIPGGSSRVNFVATVDDCSTVLCETESPSVGELLPARGIKLEGIHSKSLVNRILSKVNKLFSSVNNVYFNKISVVRVVSGPETDGMAVSFVP